MHIWFICNTMRSVSQLWKMLCKTRLSQDEHSLSCNNSAGCVLRPLALRNLKLHQKTALTTRKFLLRLLASTVERVGSNKISQSEVDRVISEPGQPGEPSNLKKPTALRGVAGVWDRESGDYIKGRGGACYHAVGSLAGAGG